MRLRRDILLNIRIDLPIENAEQFSLELVYSF